jgi:N utilization substance protein A
MNKEILYVVDAVSNEKNVEPDVIFGAVELALATATRKRYSLDWDVRVEIDRETGDYSSYRRWLVLDDEDPEFNDLKRQILFSYAQRKEADIEVGGYIEEAIDSVEFGRIAAQSAKQVIVQKVREAERQRVVDQYRERIGELIIGTVKRRERRGIILDLGENAEALIPREEMLSREMARVGGRMRGYLKEVRDEGRSPRVIVSRVDPNFLIELMKLEVPEIGQEMIDIKAVARDPGSRSKVAVMSNIPNLDPVGACVGMRGSRIQTVTDELNKERVDIILWDEDIATFVIKAMSPAEVLSILVDEERQSMDISVADDRLSQAIGVGGQNVRLASELTGWHLNVMTETQMLERDVEDQQKVLDLFMTHLDVEEDIASVLVEEGFTSIDEVAYVSDEEFLSIEVFDEGIVAELRNRAQNALLTMAISGEGDLPHEDLKTMDGMDEELAFRLAKQGVKSMEDLAELSVDELLEKGELGEENEEYAGQLIMIARAPWFAEDNDE